MSYMNMSLESNMETELGDPETVTATSENGARIRRPKGVLMEMKRPLLLGLAVILASLALLVLVLSLGFSAKESVTMDKLVVLGGYASNSHFDVEVIDLSTKKLSCDKPSDTKIMGRAIGEYLSGRAIICGGVDVNSDVTDVCYEYEPSSDKWVRSSMTLTSPRKNAQGIKMSDSLWWIIGGVDRGSSWLSTTELCSLEKGCRSHVTLPSANCYVNAIKVNDTSVMLVCGHKGNAWMFNINTLKFVTLPGIPRTRNMPMGGLVTYVDGSKEVVIAGGWDKTISDIFNLQTQTWRGGPSLPKSEELWGANAVQYQDSFLLIGGDTQGSQSSADIFLFDPDTLTWTKLVQSLKIARDLSAAFLVPHDLMTCE